MMHDEQKTIQVSFDIKFIKLNQKYVSLAWQTFPLLILVSPDNLNIEQEGHEALNRSPEYTGQSQTFNFEI